MLRRIAHRFLDSVAVRVAARLAQPGGGADSLPTALASILTPPAAGVEYRPGTPWVSRIDEDGHPRTDPLTMQLRQLAIMRWNIKVLSARMAELTYDANMAGAVPTEPVHMGLTARLCRQADIESDWLRHWCMQLQIQPIYSRKIWEYGYVLQGLWEAGMLVPGRRGLGFAVGTEALPAFFASRGLDVLATDLDSADTRAADWAATAQHAAALEPLFRPSLLSRKEFDAHCRYQPVDMNRIPAELYGQFDFCWSMCSFEHLGSIELGLRFVENSVRCLKPGGTAVHTTEFNLESDTETPNNWPTVLFRRQDIATLAERLAAAGHTMSVVDFDTGTGLLDRLIDGPPYDPEPGPGLAWPSTAHMRLSVDGFAATSIGLIIRAG